MAAARCRAPGERRRSGSQVQLRCEEGSLLPLIAWVAICPSISQSPPDQRLYVNLEPKNCDVRWLRVCFKPRSLYQALTRICARCAFLVHRRDARADNACGASPRACGGISPRERAQLRTSTLSTSRVAAEARKFDFVTTRPKARPLCGVTPPVGSPATRARGSARWRADWALGNRARFSRDAIFGCTFSFFSRRRPLTERLPLPATEPVRPKSARSRPATPGRAGRYRPRAFHTDIWPISACHSVSAARPDARCARGAARADRVTSAARSLAGCRTRRRSSPSWPWPSSSLSRRGGRLLPRARRPAARIQSRAAAARRRARP